MPLLRRRFLRLAAGAAALPAVARIARAQGETVDLAALAKGERNER
jgi:hypothetical protein